MDDRDWGLSGRLGSSHLSKTSGEHVCCSWSHTSKEGGFDFLSKSFYTQQSTQDFMRKGRNRPHRPRALDTELKGALSQRT